MAPVFGGLAIGLMIGVPILVLAILIRWLMVAEWARADAIRARGLARNERTRQWLVKHHVPFARLLTRSIAG